MKTKQSKERKTFKVKVQQIETYSDVIEVEASCEDEALASVEARFTIESLADMKNTYQDLEMIVEIVSEQPRTYSVEELFSIDEEESDEEVIKVGDLTNEQKRDLGLPVASPRSIIVVSTYGSLVVNYYTGKVIECKAVSKQELNIEEIEYFDLEEYRKYFDNDVPETIELYKLGYWTKGGEYSTPEKEY